MAISRSLVVFSENFAMVFAVDPLGALEVGEHEDVEELRSGSGPEGVEARPEAALEGRLGARGVTSRYLSCGRIADEAGLGTRM